MNQRRVGRRPVNQFHAVGLRSGRCQIRHFSCNGWRSFGFLLVFVSFFVCLRLSFCFPWFVNIFFWFDSAWVSFACMFKTVVLFWPRLLLLLLLLWVAARMQGLEVTTVEVRKSQRVSGFFQLVFWLGGLGVWAPGSCRRIDGKLLLGRSAGFGPCFHLAGKPFWGYRILDPAPQDWWLGFGFSPWLL